MKRVKNFGGQLSGPGPPLRAQAPGLVLPLFPPLDANVDDTLVLIKPNIPTVLTKFNKFNKNLKFTVDKFPNGPVHFLDIMTSTNNTDI